MPQAGDPDFHPSTQPYAPNETTQREVENLLQQHGLLTEYALKYRIFDSNPVDIINDYCKQHNKVFRDPHFLCKELEDSGQHTELIWVRPRRINPQMQLFDGDCKFAECNQGGLGNCGVTAMCSAIQSMEIQPLRKNMYPSGWNPHGAYSLKTMRNGRWGYVLFDDLIPCATNRHDNGQV